MTCAFCPLLFSLGHRDSDRSCPSCVLVFGQRLLQLEGTCVWLWDTLGNGTPELSSDYGLWNTLGLTGVRGKVLI